MVKYLVQGNSGIKEQELAENSIHHFFKRMYAGVVETLNDIKEKGSSFNAKNLLSATFCWHPADKDPHKLAHYLDAEGTYHYQHDGEFCKSTISGIRAGDTVYVPILEVKGKDGKYKSAICENTLLITSSGAEISHPTIPGKEKQKSILSEKVIYYMPETGGYRQSSRETK